ncbi:MAG: zinc ribbon domain-containing protein [Chloroflexota bacterium]
MPLYEYFCPDCRLKFELLRPVAQATERAPCPRCAAPTDRAVSAFCAVSRDTDGHTMPAGGSSCGTCSGLSCATCGQ